MGRVLARGRQVAPAERLLLHVGLAEKEGQARLHQLLAEVERVGGILDAELLEERLDVRAADEQSVVEHADGVAGGGDPEAGVRDRPVQLAELRLGVVRAYPVPPSMKTTISTKGQFILPAEIRQRDGIEPGQEFEVERIDRGEYRLVRRERPPNQGLVEWLLACPEKGSRPDRVRIDRQAVTYLVDANVLSEATKPAPDARVVRWLRQNEREIAVDPFILGEIRFGIYLLPAGRRRRRLEQWFNEGVARIACLPWEAPTGLRWAKLLADLRASGQALPIKDSLIAATAIVHG